MKKVPLALALIGATSLLLAACGGGDGEGDDTSAGAGSGNPVDRAFVAGMIPHHESAIEMANMAQDQGQSEFVTSLADDIVRTQGEEIDQMRKIDSQLAADGVAVGDLGISEEAMGMQMSMSDLASSKQFDRMFMEMMIEHHRSAIRMAQVERERGENEELTDLAQRVIDAQSREISEMNAQLGSPASDASTPDDSGGGAGSSMDDMGM